MKIASTKRLWALAMLLILAPLGASLAQNAAPPANTRLQVQVVQLKPGRAAEWRALQQNEVIPALKKAGVTTRTTLETLFGNTNEYVTLRPLDKFAEYDEQQGLLQRVLGTQAGNALAAKLADCTVSSERYVITQQGALAVANPAPIYVSTRLRLQPGPGGGAAFADFLRTDVLPMMQKAQAAGTVAGFGVSITNQGAEEQGLRITTTYYPTLAALDAAVAAGGVAQATLGEAQAATLATKQARLATAVYTTIRRRVADLSY